MALVRKRLQTTSLRNEQFLLGSQSRTKVSLLYLEHIASPGLIDEARRRLGQFKDDALLSSSQLEEWLADSKYSLFPLLDHIGRPDFVAAALLRGRFAILVNGSPMALIAPSNLTEQVKSPEDLHTPYYFVIFERLLRFSGLFIAIFLPGFWLALNTYHPAQLPLQLLATVTISRVGLPFNTTMEFILITWFFEIFREASVRLPRASNALFKLCLTNRTSPPKW